MIARLPQLLCVLAAAAALAVAGCGGTDISPIDENSVQQQIDGIEQFLRDNTQ